ncbi:phage portal protein [Paenibacillus sp. 19GGS1-52]|uniref:XkdW family protein n=1 Tax=Paenibacillus sp. 19GGS1-52 TaxID=2758563 RepID=UPI001EFB0CA0|nr:XkdW family protein [Paenibacillus sp. 19GGS1-52]ULO08150.1 phage portal protein [Paenibacillus sp. 19GGS1-52]
MNIALSIMHLYPDSDPMKDFIVQDDSDGNGPYIALWNLDKPQPTESELLTAWEAYLEVEANKPPVLTEIEQVREELAQTKLALTDNYEQLLATQDEATSAQLALTEMYEWVLTRTGGEE